MLANNDHLTGQNDNLIDYQVISTGLHKNVVAPFQLLHSSAAEAGFDLTVASSYRDFDRQLLIWNAKASGERPVLDSLGKVLKIDTLEPWALVQAILRWSALPGASRHHWGTDLDVYDKTAVAEDYVIELTSAEVSGNGPFVPFHKWLDQKIVTGQAQGFFRPYQYDTNGIAPERWHLSYAPLASEYQSALDIDCLVALISSRPIALKEVILKNIEEIFERFIVVADECYPLDYQQDQSKLIL
jgi:LAS superfamily LD-carboxypeptidase LdcB